VGGGGGQGGGATASGGSGPGGSGGTGGSAAGPGGAGAIGGGGGTGGAGGAGGSGGANADLVHPLLEAVGLVDGALLRTARIRVSISASDDLELVALGYALNGAPEITVPLPPDATSGAADLDLTPTRGDNELLLFAEDAAGNRSELPLTARWERRVAAGGSHTGALVSGAVRVWGRNNLTQLGLGDADTTSRFTPEALPGLSNVTAIDFRQNQSMALAQDGTLWLWGNNADGRLGLGTLAMPDTTNRGTPTANPSLAGVLQATFGYDHALVLLEDGTVRAFGDNSLGQLGDGSTDDRSYPVQALGLGDIVQVAAGSKHSLALERDGTVWAWGRNEYGNLGQGAIDLLPHATPTQVPGLTGVVQLASGRDHILALRADGSLYAWGLNQNGQVGVGTSGDGTDVHAPAQVAIGGTVVAVSADGNCSFATRDDGSALGWGQNFNGQLGIGGDDTTDRNAPLDPVALPLVVDVEPGATHAVGLTGNGAFYTWGWSTNGSLGRANLLNNWAYPTPGLVTLP
jgi:alpha-tubulin suppressor-like RCC1 family protein